MKNAFPLLFDLLLVVCLALYGPYGMAKAGVGGDVFSMGICGDGVANTVLVGMDGQPVEPMQDCSDCLTCCNAIGSHPRISCGVAPSFALLEIEPDSPSFQSPTFRDRNLLPAPRGPPAGHFSMQGSPNMIGFDQAITGHKKRSDGHPLLRDANA